MKISIKLGLALALFFQTLVLVGMYALAQIPLWTGQEIKLQTLPVDPRSMFRGNYTRLRYDISQIDSAYFPERDQLRRDEVVYVTLKPNDEGYYTHSSVSLTPPKSGLFIRGRIDRRYSRNGNTSFRLKYGIEAFFMPKEKALALEKDLRNGGLAVLMLGKNGKARLKNVIAKP